MEVIEVDQISSTSLRQNPAIFASLKSHDDIMGEEARKARFLFGGHFKRRIVDESTRLYKGYVWFVSGEDGLTTLYRTNYESA